MKIGFEVVFLFFFISKRLNVRTYISQSINDTSPKTELAIAETHSL